MWIYQHARQVASSAMEATREYVHAALSREESGTQVKKPEEAQSAYK